MDEGTDAWFDREPRSALFESSGLRLETLEASEWREPPHVGS